jgi:hypothetical protein
MLGEGAREFGSFGRPWTHDIETNIEFVDPFSLLCGIYTAEHSIRSPLDLATVARCRCSGRPGDNPGRPRELCRRLTGGSPTRTRRLRGQSRPRALNLASLPVSQVPGKAPGPESLPAGLQSLASNEQIMP